MVIVNWASSDYKEPVEVSLDDLGINIRDVESVTLRDLWKQEDVSILSNGQKSIKVDGVPAYGNYAFRIKRYSDDSVQKFME